MALQVLIDHREDRPSRLVAACAVGLLASLIGCGGASGVGTINTDAAHQERAAKGGRDFVAQPPTPAEIRAKSNALRDAARKGQISPGG